MRSCACAVHEKYCNHLLAVDMTVWHVYRGLWCACCWENVKRWESVKVYCSVIRSYLVWLLLGIPSLGDCDVRVVGKMSKDMGDGSP